MTTILGRYIFRQAGGAVIGILAALTCVIWIAVAMRQMDVLTDQGQSSWLFFKMTALALPTLLSFIAPIAMLIAIVHVLNRLNSDSELIISTAGGASAWSLLWPLMALGLIVSVAVTLVAHIFAPMANRHLRDLTLQAKTDLISQVLQPGRFTSPEQKLTFHIRDKAADGRLLGMLMHDARDPAQERSYLAENGYIVQQNGAAYLIMNNGHILSRQQRGGAAEIIAFQRYVFDISNRFEQRAEAGLVIRPRERLSSELMNPDPNDPIWKETPARVISELHDRITLALYPLAFVVIAIAFVGQAQTTRQNRNNAVIGAIGSGFAVRIIGIGAVNSSVSKTQMIPFVYAVPIAAIFGAVLLIWWNLTPRPQSAFVRRLASFNSALVLALKSPFARKGKQSRSAAG